MKRNRLLILQAVFLIGAIVLLQAGAIFLLLVFGLISYLICKNSPEEDRKFILTLLVTGFTLRVFLAVTLHAIVYLKGYHCISGDDLLYTLKGWGVVCGWDNKPTFWLHSVSAASTFGLNPFTYLVAAFYKSFGFHPVTVKMINCIIGTSTGWIAYLIAREIFDRKAARIAMLIVVFYPSLVRWSVANLKDPITIFAFMACAYILIAAARRKIELWKYMTFLLSAGVLYFFPHKLYFAVISCASVLTVILKYSGALVRFGIKKARVLWACFIVFMVSALSAVYLYPLPLVKFLFYCEKKQAGISRADFAGYYLYTKELLRSMNLGLIDIPELLKVTCANVSYFMLTPFPAQMMASRERLMVLPQMLLWYLILALSIFGFIKLLLRRGEAALLIGVMLSMGIVISAMVEGNIGSAFRHRDVFSPFFIILASGVLSELSLRRGGS